MFARYADHGSGPSRYVIAATPAIVGLLLVVIVNLPLSVTARMLPAPMLALAATYYWVLFRPDLMPPFAVFLTGLLEDVLSGGPPGLWAAGFLAAYLLADRERETLSGLTGIGAMLGFAGSVLAASATAYLLLFAVYFETAPVLPLLLEAVVTVLVYPLVALAMRWLQRRLFGSLRHYA